MTRSCVVLVLVAAVSTIGVSAQPAASVEQEVIRLKRTLEDAFVKKDRAVLDRSYAADYVYTHSNGSVLDKAQEIAQAISADANWSSISYDDLRVRVYGDAALISGVETLQGKSKGYVPGPRRFTDVWLKRNGRWHEVGGQSTVVAANDSAATAQSAVKQLTPKALAASSDDERAVVQADDTLTRADIANDDAKSRALQTADYSFVSRSGVLAAPSDPPGPTIKSMVIAYDRLRMFPSLAIVQGSMLWTDVKGFSPGVLRFTRVWIKDGSAWKLAAEQRTAAATTRPIS